MDGYNITKTAAMVLDAKKAADIEVIKVEGLTILADYFVIASATNPTHVKALADEVELMLKKQGVEVTRTEGYSSANWIILDYSTVIVHIFLQETRDFYNLGRLWADGMKIELNDLIK